VGQHSELIPAALAGERVDRVVAMATGVSRKRAAELIDASAVALNGAAVASRSVRVAVDDVLDIDLPEPTSDLPVADAGVSVEVIWEDADLAVIDKPADLVVHPGAGNQTGTLVNGLLARYPQIADVGEPNRPGIVHRLDRGTTGLLAVALTQHSYEALVQALSERRVERTYLAVSWGHLDDSGVIDSPVGRSLRNPTRMAVTPRGKEARTHYDLLRRFDEPAALSVLHCRLETGRTHQIRVHLAAIGHPVVGDTAYGGGRDGIEFDRPALHATRLAFEHPVSGERLDFESPAPVDMQKLLDRLA
jgi:23S rRNA pseudouridine1911/1915/1917 synthase